MDIEQTQGDNPRGSLMDPDENYEPANWCSQCDEWIGDEVDDVGGGLCDDCRVDHSEDETVVGTVAAQCARAARLKREAEDRANFEEKERD